MKKTKPNIIVFMADQLRRDALGCYGNTICRTPNIDRLAQEAVKFNNAFTTSPVCSPSRASFLTGLYPHNHGVMINTHIAPAWSRGLSPDIPTFSNILKKTGYVLDYAGKWHVHEDLRPEEFGFSRYTGLTGKREIVPGTGIKIEFPGHDFFVAGTNLYQKEKCPTWKCTDRGIAMMRDRVKKNTPFFLRIDVADPHFANVPPQPYASMYNPAEIPPWPNFDESFVNKPAAHLRKHREWHLEDKTWRWWSNVVSKYYGDVTLIDDCVGRVLKAIKDLGIEDNTIFVFTTDHGDAAGSHKHIEKAETMYDEIYRIPLIIKTPAAWGRSGEISSFVRLLDLMPAFVELAGGEIPDDIDGRSIVPFLKGETPYDWFDSVYCEHHGEVWGYQSQRMVRTDKWKYAYNPHDLDELYDLDADPYEMKNLAYNIKYKDVFHEMKARLLGWNDYTKDMFQWSWVRWNFPEPVSPLEITKSRY